MDNAEATSGGNTTSELARFVLLNIEAMAHPPTEWEAQVLQEILTLPQVTVSRPPERQLLDAGMIPHNCHENCSAQEANDPEKQHRHVAGWLVFDSDLILHSVVEADGQWYCLTPQLVPATPRFQFIPDPSIEWICDAASGINEAYRHGVKLPFALRRFPEDHIRMRDRFNILVSEGMSLLDARREVDATLGIEIKRMRQEGLE
ncbi:hypothetical protein RHI9324_02166 [Rhizobium sp. CECT 9324]|nr:hypothetical protein RHI9324_02166 [Rhizobium sp. CECT 9324]